MRFYKKPSEPNSYTIEKHTPFSFSRSFVLIGSDADEQQEESRRKDRSDCNGRRGMYQLYRQLLCGSH